jgi:pimeloyl-ACP methyl ester carboxylesterase
MPFVHSRDGTPIGFERAGNGPPLILVDGALCYRASGPSRPLAKLLTDRFTVYTYDRRGRGDSADTPPYAIAREIEDLEALIEEAGEPAFVYGISSGAALALEAANNGAPIRKLALYEAPFIVDDKRSPIEPDFLSRLETAIAENRRGDAVRMFMRFVGLPAPVIFFMRFLPMWSKLTAIAPTLAYDIRLVQDHEHGVPLRRGEWSAATVPTLVADGGKSPAWMRNAMRSLSEILPNATHHTVPGQTHMLSAAAIAPVLTEFFTVESYSHRT